MAAVKEDKPWGGRFSGASDELLEVFSSSIHFDYKLYPYDIAGSTAHAKMLGRQGLISKEEAKAIVKGLQDIKKDIDAGRFEWDPKLEDVHMNIERRLSERIGEAGEKLHTARSRNDQVALDTRLFVRDALGMIREALFELRKGFGKPGRKDQKHAHAGIHPPAASSTRADKPPFDGLLRNVQPR